VHTSAEERRTIAEWEEEYGLVILDYDGFEAVADPRQDLKVQRFTRAEFEQAVASCTVVWSRRAGNPAARERLAARRRDATETAGRAPRDRAAAPAAPAAASAQPASEAVLPARPARRARRVRAVNVGRWRRRFLVWFTLPALAEWAVAAVLAFARERLGVRWWWPAALGAAALFVTCVVPGTTLLSGPLFVWYEIVRWGAGLAMAGLGHAAHAVVGGTPPAWTDVPRFLTQMVWFGTPLPDYFTISRAVTSSVVLGALTGAAADLWVRIKGRHRGGKAGTSSVDGADRPDHLLM
jgi:hypothetical protein